MEKTISKRKIINIFISFFLTFILIFCSVGCAPQENNNDNLTDTEIGADSETDENDNQVDDNQNNNDSGNDGNNSNTDDKNDGENQNDDNNSGNNDKVDDENSSIEIIGFGDSISAGYAVSGSDMYSSYIDYVNGDVVINSMCYTKLIADEFMNNEKTANVKSYAKSGDKTNDLISILQNISANQSMSAELQNADIITLCIGANNVLGVLLDNNMANTFSYLTGNMTDDQISALFEQGYQNFVNDYTNAIIPYLTSGNATVYVMTIYDPYKYFDSNEVIVDQDDFLKDFLENCIQKFNPLKNIAISYLSQINDYIRNYAHENLVVVDVNQKFESLTRQEYNAYINANSYGMTLSTNNLFNLVSMSNFDPHPTSSGQEYIASIFLEAIEENEGE